MSDKRSVHTKIDEILKSIQAKNARISHLEKPVQDINLTSRNVGQKLTKRCDELRHENRNYIGKFP